MRQWVLTLGFALAVLPLGYMAENPGPTARKEVAKVTRFIAPKTGRADPPKEPIEWTENRD